MISKYRQRLSVIIVLSLLCSSIGLVNAQTCDFNLEAEQNWDTYGIGGTCVYGTNNIFVGDVDSDDEMEIITGGFSYYPINNSENNAIADKYRQLSKNSKNIIFGGRLAEYKYYDMHQVIGSALKKFKTYNNDRS